jgi:ribosomal protein S3
MMNVKWYNDMSAKIAYDHMRYKLDPIIEEMFPNYELSHVGVNRNEVTEEVTIKLHLNQIGSVRVTETYTDNNDFRKLK